MMTWDERMVGLAAGICGMCGVGQMGEKLRQGHRIYCCLDCGWECTDITHYDSKVLAQREKMAKNSN